MSYTHRGLSDVVTTVLIILLVVVAVVAIGSYVRTGVDQSGRTLERNEACLTNMVAITSCKYAGTALTLDLKRTSDDNAVSSAGNLQVSVKPTTGALQTIATASITGSAPTGTEGHTTVTTASAALTAGTVPSEATLITEFTLKNGNKVTCSSTPVPCSA